MDCYSSNSIESLIMSLPLILCISKYEMRFLSICTGYLRVWVAGETFLQDQYLTWAFKYAYV